MPNQLIHASSPYLRQHANNPVDWYPWGEEALTLAQAQNKPLLVSIGYAACHWCHVMEHESFEDKEVADIMNAHFINIKVDREERPDVDKYYMDAVMLMRQQGGWPLNVIALPDKRPIFGGTYFPKDRWKQVLMQVANAYKQDRSGTLAYADRLQQAMDGLGQVEPVKEPLEFEVEEFRQLGQQWLEQVDTKWGGRQRTRNKFPLPQNNLCFLRLGTHLEAPAIHEAVTVTLQKMAFGGIYDHLGGGFARYAVDPYWKVPHFEKMLYDNGQLASLYAEAYQRDPQDLYRRVLEDTLAFVARELTSPEGGFYSSLDADSEGEEGKYYVWTYEEVEQLLGEDARLFADYYNVHPMGNWEHTNVLFVLETEADFARRWELEEADFRQRMAAGRQKLLDARAERVRPGLDDKILTSWNALMLKGYVDAYRVLGTSAYLEAAIQNATFLRNQLSEGGKLYRNYKDGKRSIPAFLDDYAYLIEALLALYQVTFDEAWLYQAREHLSYVMAHFSDDESGMFFYSSDEEEALGKRKIELTDDVIPSSNASLAHGMHQLGLLFHEIAYRDRAMQMLRTMKAEIQKGPSWHAHWLSLWQKISFPHYEVAITGAGALEARAAFERVYQPHRLFAGAEAESDLPLLAGRFGDSLTLYVCQENACQLPVHTVEEALEQMNSTA